MTDTVEKISHDLKQFAISRDWEQFHTPKNLSMALIAEAAELVEHFQWLTPEQSKTVSGKKLEDISLEMADILIYLLRMAEQLDIDLMPATRKKMAINEKRFPVNEDTGDAITQNHKDNIYTKP
jgi:dCTP diphosphatase